MFLRCFVVISIIGLTGCLGTEEYTPVNETLISYKGKVVEKTQIIDKNKEHRYAMERAQTNREFAGVVGDLYTAFGVDLLDVTIPGQPIKYSVKLENSKKVLVYSNYNGFDVGQCVVVLVVQETQEVRMTSGSECVSN